MNEIEKKFSEKAKAGVKQMLEDCGYTGEERKIFKEGAKAGAKLMQELLQEECEDILIDEGYGDRLEKWKAENECEQ